MQSKPWRPPRRLNILEQSWPVDMAADVTDSDGNPLEGDCSRTRREIRLSTAAPEGVGEIFCHELLHALWYAGGFSAALEQAFRRYGLPQAAARALADEIDEMHSQAVGPILWAVLRRNRLRFD